MVATILAIPLNLIKFYGITCLYVILCLMVARLGKQTTIGFWGMLFLSILLTPIIPGIFVLVVKPWKKDF